MPQDANYSFSTKIIYYEQETTAQTCPAKIPLIIQDI